MKERELIRKREEELEEPDIGNTTLDEIDSEVRRPVGVINVLFIYYYFLWYYYRYYWMLMMLLFVSFHLQLHYSDYANLLVESFK